MTRDDIIRMAREAGASFETAESMFRFAALVAAVEREACAQDMDRIAKSCRHENSDPEPFLWAAAMIRARGDA